MLNNIGIPGLLLIAVVVLVLFGRGKISQLMGDVGKGITSFKRGMAEGQEEDKQLEEPRDVTPAEAATTRTAETAPADARDRT
ncbi:twin-arginine translocase TatA/TatE family subunit [Roseobacter sp. HKCCA0434]|uniref:twin-arginine translocase TatA/TatE family subunit n=1 Tax=Roseobacter sp. HKCCA0434 TaxID=3079297 RepID=UPI002905BD0A|nr:twin-arginine translocase TatA/TatE family subunit [Roseobacter sp. HKCCA0434]